MELSKDFSAFLGNNSNNSGGSGSEPAQPAQSGGLSKDFAAATNDKPKKLDPTQRSAALDQIISEEGADQLRPVIQALYGQESGSGANARTSIDGARGGMQIIPATFSRYAKPGERIDSDTDNLRVGVRIVKDLGQKFGNDPAKIAAGYFSGEGNVNNGGGNAWKTDYADGNGKRVSAYVGDVLTRIGAVPDKAQAAAQDTRPDLSKAPKWSDVTAKPEFQKLTDDQKAQAKSAYFDYWIAPYAGQDAQKIRDQFLSQKDEGPGLLSRIGDAASSAYNTVKDAVTGKSVMEGAPAQTVAKDASLAPVRPELRAALEAQYDAATPEQRQTMATRDDYIGQIARARMGGFARQDQSGAKDAMQTVDPRIEARRAQLLKAGEDPRAAETFARLGAERGITPGREIAELGSVKASNYDFETKNLFDPNKDPNGLNNPLVRGLAKGGVGLAKAVVGYTQAMADLMGMDGAAKYLASAGDSLRGKEEAIGERGDFGTRNLEGAINSIAQQLPLLIGGVGAASEALPLAGIALQTFGQEYSDGKAQGQTPGESSLRASLFAAFEVIGEKFSLGAQMDQIRGVLRSAPTSEMVHLFKEVIKKEIPGEMLTTTGQFAVDKLPGGVGLNQQAGAGDFLDQQIDTVAQTVLQSVLMGGGTTGLAKGVEFLRDRGPSAGVAEADANLAQQQATQAWQNLGKPGQNNQPTDPAAPVGPAAGAPAPAPTVDDVRADGTLTPGQMAPTPADAGAVNGASVSPSPTKETPAYVKDADQAVRELAQMTGMPLDELGLSEPDVPVTDSDAVTFARNRLNELRNKQNGTSEDMIDGAGQLVSVDQPGGGLSAQEQAELSFLESPGATPEAIRNFYFNGVPNEAQAQTIQNGPAPSAPAPNDATQDNAAARNAEFTDGQPVGTAAEPSPSPDATQAPGAEDGAVSGQRLDGQESPLTPKQPAQPVEQTAAPAQETAQPQFKAEDTVKIKGEGDRIFTVTEVGPDGWVYMRDGGAFPPEKAAELFTKAERNLESTGAAFPVREGGPSPSNDENRARWAAENEEFLKKLAEGPKTPQYESYAKAIREGKYSSGMAQQIAMDERLNNGESQLLARLAQEVSQQQPAKPKTEKEANQQKDYSDKWFGTAEKAQEFIDKKRIGDTHAVVQDGKRFLIKPKEQGNGTEAAQAQQTAQEKPQASDTGTGQSVEPYQQTAEEWHKAHTEDLITRFKFPAEDATKARAEKTDRIAHQEFLETALEEGKQIPQRVLDDYKANGIEGDLSEFPRLAKAIGAEKPTTEKEARAAKLPKAGDILFNQYGEDYRVESEKIGEVTLTKNPNKLSEQTVRMNSDTFERLVKEDAQFRAESNAAAQDAQANADVSKLVTPETLAKLDARKEAYQAKGYTVSRANEVDPNPSADVRKHAEEQAKAPYASLWVVNEEINDGIRSRYFDSAESAMQYGDAWTDYKEPKGTKPKTEKEAKAKKAERDNPQPKTEKEAKAKREQEAMLKQLEADLRTAQDKLDAQGRVKDARLADRVREIESAIEQIKRPEIYKAVGGVSNFSKAVGQALEFDTSEGSKEDTIRRVLKNKGVVEPYLTGMTTSVLEAIGERKVAPTNSQAQNESTTEEKQNANTVQSNDVPAGRESQAGQDATAGNRDSQPVATGVATSGEGTAGQERVPTGTDAAGSAGTGSTEQPGNEPSGTARDSAGNGTEPSAADRFIIDEGDIGKGGLTKKYRDNVEAIRLLKTLENEGRVATPEERKVLAKYVGWGALKGPFDPENKQWSKQHAELKELLSDAEFKAARRSTLDAHYTSPVVVKAMYGALQRMGFNGGRVLEPSVGIGNFFGLMPRNLRQNTSLFGVELDSLTARMVSALYPESKIAKATGFEDYEVPGEFFDAVIGNPPFGNQPLVDKDRTAYSGFSIHNYFLAKGIDKLRPGGVMAVVVSHNFLDAQDNRARKWIAERASLVGAVRLPNTAFQENAGTSVVTDILVFQKNGTDDMVTAADAGNWTNVVDQKNINPKTNEEVTHKVNEFFAKNPNMVLGKPSAAGTMYSGNEYTVEDTGNLEERLMKWAENTLPKNTFQPVDRSSDRQVVDMAVPDGVKVGSYYVEPNGQVMMRVEDLIDVKRAVEWNPLSIVEERIKAGEFKDEKTAKAARTRAEKSIGRMKGMIQLRDTLRTQMRLERSPDSTEQQIEVNRDLLNKQYDAFQKNYGFLNDQANRAVFLDDTESQLVQALEFDYDKGIGKKTAETEGIDPRPASATKADIFKRRVAFPPQDFIKVQTAKDALLSSLNFRGRLDLDYMAQVYNKSPEEITKELGDVVFQNLNGGLVMSDEYLSGDVKTKLEEAKAAAQDDPTFKRNVEALEKVIPADKKPSEISVSLGASFLPAQVYQDFFQHLTGGKATMAYIKATGQWVMDYQTGTLDQTKNTGTFGTKDLSAAELFDLLLKGRGAVVKKIVKNPDGGTTTILMEKETELAREKQNAIKAEWQKWLWSDTARADQVASLYNDKLNRIVDRKYDGSHMTFPGMNPAIQLLDHQKNGVWRGLQSRQILYDHVVGAGKTFQMAALAMEMRRLGIARKPIFVVPNHLTLQWRSEFTRLYPGSNVLAATPEDFAEGNRERMFSKIVTGDWDAVVIGHSSLKKIGLPEETEKGVLQEQIDEISEAIEQMKRVRGDKNIVRDVEKIRSNLENKMKEKLNAIGDRDKVVSFDELGIDAMFVDEMHEFKNLTYNSTMDRNPGMGNPAGSAKAFDMFVKVRWLFDTFGSKTPFITATGTPVSNSLVEMFNMQRYMQYPTLKQEGLHVFDAWAKQFGSVENVYEVALSGSGYRQSTRFAKFTNLPALMSLYNSFTDTITLDDLKAQEEAQGKEFPVPLIQGGRPTNIVAKRSPLQAEFMGVPRAVTNSDGAIQFFVDLNQPIQIDKNDKDKYVAKVGESNLGEFETEEEARLKVVEKAMSPIVSVDPKSILGMFGRLKQLTSESKGKINALSLTGLANKAGLDFRLINPAAADFPGSKINLAVGNMLDLYKKFAKVKGTQIVFCDMSIPLSAKSTYATKARRLYVRDDENNVDMKRGTMHTVQDLEEFPFFVVERGKKEGRRFDAYDAASGIKLRSDFMSKQEAVDGITALLQDQARRDKLVQRREQLGDIAQEDIDAYNDENEIETEGIEYFSQADIAGASGATGFSVYDDIKAKLMANGVPENEIAFIHDYATPTAKDKLFKAVKSGQVRFLLGSTPKLGAGTNVQDRLVGLHHIDAPWKPSDLEQREGRIIRRGNKLAFDENGNRIPGFEVFIGRYATEQTYDTRRWQILEHKARGIEQLRNYDGSMTEIEDIDGEAANAADMKAAASGDPLILQETQLRNEVKRLERLQSAHADEALALARKARLAKDYFENTGPKKLAEIQQLIDSAKSNPLDKDGNAPTVVDSRKITDTKKAAEEIAQVASLVRADLRRNVTVKYRGIEFEFTLHLGHTLYATTPVGTLGTWTANDTFSGSGFMTRMNNFIDRLQAIKEDETKTIERFKKDAVNLLEESKKPFAEADALAKVREEHKKVQRALMAKGPEVPAEQKAAVAQAMEEQRRKLIDLGFEDAVNEFYGAGGASLNDIARPQTETPEFKRWFGDSKVVDAGGKPLVVYHGTTADFDTFDKDKIVRKAAGTGFYFTSDRGQQGYAEGNGANVMPVYLSIKNPTSDPYLFRTDLSYDGLIFPLKSTPGVTHYAVREPEQIKSATGNRGTFDGTDPNILNDLQTAPSSHFTTAPEAVRTDALTRLKSLEVKREAGKITEAEYRLGVQQLISRIERRNDARADRRAEKGRRRGADWIVAQLRRGYADGNVPRDEVEFAEWLLAQNPNLADDLGISISGKTTGAAGNYNPLAKIIKLFSSGLGNGTTVHEILHHSERMMPEDVQAGIVKEWRKAWSDTYRNANDATKAALDNMLRAAIGDNKAWEQMRKDFRNGTLNYADHYQLYSPSEFWAVNGTRLLVDRFVAKDSWIKKAAVWLKEFVQRVKNLLGLKSDAPILKALNSVLEADGQFQSDRMLTERQDSGLNVRVGSGQYNNVLRSVQRNLINFFANQKETTRTFSKYDKSLSTQYNKALKDKDFGKVFGYVNAMQNEVSLTAIRPAELAPGVLPRVDDFKSAAKQLVFGKKTDKNLSLASQAVFEGTLHGNNVMEGRVWTEAEFKGLYGNNDTAWGLYQQTRKAIDASLDEVAAAEAYAIAQGYIAKGFRRAIIDNPMDAQAIIGTEMDKQMGMMRMAIKAAVKQGDENAAAKFMESLRGYKDAAMRIEKVFVTAANLKDHGYAPLMRFGKYSVTVKAVDPMTGNVLRNEQGDALVEHYAQYETEAEALEAKRELEKEYEGEPVEITTGPKSEKANQLYAGLSPETIALFAEAVGAEKATKKFYEMALSERSALKRRLERKNIEGYSRDLPRVLSNFITSNARFAAQRYYLRDLNNAIKFIPNDKGDVKDEAIALKQFVINPDDKGSAASAVMFAWFLGGSVASAVVNMTQPILMTAPYLSQFGAGKAFNAMLQATLGKAVNVAMGKKEADPELRAAMKRASREGIVDAQEIFHLYSTGAQGVASGLVDLVAKVPALREGVKAGSESARARINAFMTIWGSFFSIAEKFNRKLTFTAAYNMARQMGEKDPYAFAVRAVNETQGIYAKHNRPNWARNPFGRLLLTFKQYNLMYLEMLKRMWTRGGPAGKRAALTALAILMLVSGEEGLPFSQDLDDLIDMVGQFMDFDTNMKRSKRRLAYEILGKTVGDLFLYGATTMMPLDMGNRLGMGNLIPGTAAFKKSNEDNRGREVTEAIGPGGGIIEQVLDAFDAASAGNWGKAAVNMAPLAVKNAVAGTEAAAKGYLTDTKGRKDIEITTGEAALKGIGFNPTVKAQESRKLAPIYQDRALQKTVESDLVDRIANAIVDGNDKERDAGLKAVDDWNKNNPDTPIVVTGKQIQAKVKSLVGDKDARLIRSTPKEMRGRVVGGLSDLK